MKSPTARHETWPMERFYWAVLEAPGYTRVGPLAPGLRPLLDDEAPVPGESLHAVGVPLGGGRLLVCAAERERLAGVDAGVLRLTPGDVPEFAGGVDASGLNLLVGEFEPGLLRRARTRRHLLAMAACLACAALVNVGLLRRAAGWNTLAHDAESATRAVIHRASAGSPEALSLELRTLRSAALPASAIRGGPDAALALSSLLASWPGRVPSKPQSLMLNGSGMTIGVTVEGDPAPFLRAFKAPAGWTQEEPHLNTAGSVTRVNLQLRPAGATP